jgi:hypothetical protein
VITAISLSDDSRGLTSQLKGRYDGVAFQGLDVQGSVREVTDDIPGQDGADDLTEFAGAAAVTVALKFYGQFRAVLDEIDAYAVPWARPYLTVTDDEWAGPRVLRLRYSAANKPIVAGTGLSRAVAYQWKAPAGAWEDAAAVTYLLQATAPSTDGLHSAPTIGVSSTSAAGVAVKASAGTSDTLVTVGGNMRPPWVARLYGPCTGPALYNDSTGQGLVFTDDLLLGAGEYVELDSAARSALFLSAPDSSRLTYLDWSASSWFDLVPGTALLRYAPDAIAAGCQANLTFTPRRMA